MNGDEFPMNFDAFATNLKSGLTSSYSKESKLNNELLRTPLRRSSHSGDSRKFAKKHALKGTKFIGDSSPLGNKEGVRGRA
jgi:hypothetical protein